MIPPKMEKARQLFPAQAGVILRKNTGRHIVKTVPRASGGDPKFGYIGTDFLNCSPRKRG